jgi:group I intron endonuclease
MQTKIYYYIYEIVNLINGKNYIGQHTTNNLNDGYMGSGKALLNAYKKYGIENFKKEILLFAVNSVSLNFIERCLVTKDFINQDNNYNLREGGGATGRHSVYTRLLQSQRAKQRFLIESGTFTGKTHTAEAREKISKIHKGKKISKQHKAIISSRMKGNRQTLGRKLSEREKEVRRKASMGNKHRLGIPHTEETKKRIALAGVGRKFTIITIAKRIATRALNRQIERFYCA